MFKRAWGWFRGANNASIDDQGRMALVDHFRELRARILRSGVVIALGIIVAFFFYEKLLQFVQGPYEQALTMLGEETQSKLYIQGVGGPLLLQLKLCGLTGLIATCPWWLAEIWGFILPALHSHERKWSRIFAAIAGPLFLAGVAVGYLTMPKALQVLLGFTPDLVESLVDFSTYFSFLTRTLLVFGVSFEIPVLVVMLSVAGIVQGRQLARFRPWIILAVFVFAAVATPSTDPFTMLFLAIPMSLLMLISEVLARLLDRRREKREDLLPEVGDDEISPL